MFFNELNVFKLGFKASNAISSFNAVTAEPVGIFNISSIS